MREKQSLISQVTCLQTSHCEFSKDAPPIPVEGEDDLEFLPHLNYLGQSQLTVGPVEVGGKMKANCRKSGHVLDPEVVVLDTGDPVISLLAEVSISRVILSFRVREEKNFCQSCIV